MENAAGVARDYEKIGRFIYGFHRLADPDRLRALPGTRGMAPELAERGAALARRFDAALAAWDDDERAGRTGTAGDDLRRVLLEDVQAFVRDSGQMHGAPPA